MLFKLVAFAEIQKLYFIVIVIHSSGLKSLELCKGPLLTSFGKIELILIFLIQKLHRKTIHFLGKQILIVINLDFSTWVFFI